MSKRVIKVTTRMAKTVPAGIARPILKEVEVVRSPSQTLPAPTLVAPRLVSLTFSNPH